MAYFEVSILALPLLLSFTVVISEKEKYYMKAILPDDNSKEFAMGKVGPGISKAVETIRRENRLPQVEINLTFDHSNCDQTNPVLTFIDALKDDNLDVIVGPACDYSCAPVARITRYYRKAMVTGACLASAFGNKDQYFMTRLYPDYYGTSPPVLSIIQQYKWDMVALLYEHQYSYSEIQYCFFTIPAIQKDLVAKLNLTENDYFVKRFHLELAVDGNEGEYLENMLQEVSEHARSK
ncbi:Atrial natriuretic peptide receptor 3 [Holothuria leucospilota]|uniref:Atrial natriuretic peptide receptor 3 n=1 Tax=Holothuria leucospilota TaxID=206669 RepID=A0A9Q1BZC8_HOLLE|nr:Atrial natriuretic peptide receptor 3 [Holothuria leucospilota]